MTDKEEAAPILVPVDFSDYSEAALIQAAELAKVLNAPLIVLHVVHDLGQAPGYYTIKGRKKQLHRMEDVANEMMDDFIREARKKYTKQKIPENLETRLVTGLPVNRILETAKKSHARLIVMGSQGRTGLSHVLVGSKAEQVVRLSPIPVMIVKKHDK